MSEHAAAQGEGAEQDVTARRAGRPPGAGLAWDSCALSHVGKVRQVNEDACCVHPREALWVVADGMGGHAKGDVASSLIARAFEGLDLPGRLSGVADLVEATLMDLNAQLRALAERETGGATVGSTAVVLAAREGFGVFLWAGDSRLYRWRGGRLEQLTQDHSQVEELITRGLLQPQDAAAHHAANVITRAVGAASALFVDLDYCALEVGDRFLLCTDGLTREVPDAEIAAILAQEADAATLCRELLARTLSGGARDNVTVVVALLRAAGGAQ